VTEKNASMRESAIVIAVVLSLARRIAVSEERNAPKTARLPTASIVIAISSSTSPKPFSAAMSRRCSLAVI
jgi:ribonucleotide reductase alpha subunit